MATIRTTTSYGLVAGALRARILGGELRPAEQLPTERELCDLFAVSRITIRRALAILEEEMLVERHQGRGTYVTPSPTRRIPLLDADFSGSVAAHAPDMERRLDDWRWEPAAAAIAAQLRTLPGDRVLYARRTDLLAGKPIAYDDIHLMGRYADAIQPSDLAMLPFLERWQEVQQITLSYATQVIEAVPAKHPLTGCLVVKPGTPVLKGTETYFLAGDCPVGLFVSYYRHDLFRLTGTVRLQAADAVSAPPPGKRKVVQRRPKTSEVCAVRNGFAE
jgi:GntR family transcriptional regulator